MSWIITEASSNPCFIAKKARLRGLLSIFIGDMGQVASRQSRGNADIFDLGDDVRHSPSGTGRVSLMVFVHASIHGNQRAAGLARYFSSVTFSSQSTALPFSESVCSAGHAHLPVSAARCAG